MSSQERRPGSTFVICHGLQMVEYICFVLTCTFFDAVLGPDHEEDPEVLRGGDREQGAPPVPHHRHPSRRRILQPAWPPMHELRTQ
jgi:hypothetical protein